MDCINIHPVGNITQDVHCEHHTVKDLSTDLSYSQQGFFSLFASPSLLTLTLTQSLPGARSKRKLDWPGHRKRRKCVSGTLPLRLLTVRSSEHSPGTSESDTYSVFYLGGKQIKRQRGQKSLFNTPLCFTVFLLICPLEYRKSKRECT